MTSATTVAAAKSMNELNRLDRSSLLDMILEQNKRIQDLERLVEEQKRLRLQDSNQVEEKAAKIKEWVTNKLKELENQNKHLREQNRRQKEVVESLNLRIASLNSAVDSSGGRDLMTCGSGGSININCNYSNSLDKVQFIDRTISSSSIHTIDVTQSLKTRRPQLKKQSTELSSLPHDDDAQGTPTTFSTSNPYHVHLRQQHQQHHNSSKNGISLISIGDSQSQTVENETRQRQESPLYDCVNVELVSDFEKSQILASKKHALYEHKHIEELSPPPPPPHQFDKWELELYSLAEKTFSTLMQDSAQNHATHHDSVDTDSSERDLNTISRKSSSSMKYDLISVIKPSFTTIDGDQVVDNNPNDAEQLKQSAAEPLETQRGFKDQSSHSSSGHFGSGSNLNGNNNDGEYMHSTPSINPQSTEIIRQKFNAQDVFSSPIRSRSGKDTILRTQSVRRNPAPEKLYDFIVSDLVKRSYLVKHGALRSHNRWFLLKNFHLYSYKRETDETDKASPSMSLRLEPTFQVQITSQSGDGYPFKLTYHDKSQLFFADSPQTRDEWIRMLTVAINMSDIEAEKLTKSHSTHEGIFRMARHGHSKRCHAVLVKHVIFFLKSPIDPTPIAYVSVKGARIREVMDNNDYDLDEQDNANTRPTCAEDCSLAIYPKFSLNMDPVYLTLGSQQDTDEWFFHLSNASGVDQSSGTEFERVLTQMMIDNSSVSRKSSSSSSRCNGDALRTRCRWRDHPVMIYSDKPISQPLTNLPNETLRVEAVELFKSILLFTQVPLEPIAIDYHVCLLQNCFKRFLKYPELRNEFFAQLIKQSTFIKHNCCEGHKLSSSGSSDATSIAQESSDGSLSPTTSECVLITDLFTLDRLTNERDLDKYDFNYSTSQHVSGSTRSGRSETVTPHDQEQIPPSKGEFLQILQIISLAVSLNLPRGRLRWWLVDHLKKIANTETEVGKYASFSLQAIERTSTNGCRETIPSRMEIMSILLRNPFDHSKPHSLPVSFADGSYLVIGADGSTTVEEFMLSMSKDISIRPSPQSDFYLFADDPGDAKDLHILEPQRKVLDVVGWWEQAFKQSNSGRQHNSRVIKFLCRKRLVLKVEDDETDQERLMIVNQVNQEIVSQKIPLSDALIAELGAIMVQLTHGDYKKARQDTKLMRCVKERILANYIPQRSDCQNHDITHHIIEQWQKLSGRSAQDCIRVYLNCIRRLKLNE